MRQLALPFTEVQGFAVEDFCGAPSNALARDWLERPESWSNGRLVLWGEAGCGKTHLLHIWAAAQRATILDGGTLHGLIRPTGPVAVDDADIAPDPRTLLHLLNSATEAGFPVLMTARTPPWRQSYKLADLGSRLRASEVVEIRAPEDELLALLLTRLTRGTAAHARHRGAQLPAHPPAPHRRGDARGGGPAGPHRLRPRRPADPRFGRGIAGRPLPRRRTGLGKKAAAF